MLPVLPPNPLLKGVSFIGGGQRFLRRLDGGNVFGLRHQMCRLARGRGAPWPRPGRNVWPRVMSPSGAGVEGVGGFYPPHAATGDASRLSGAVERVRVDVAL